MSRLRYRLHVALDRLRHLGQRCSRCGLKIHEDNPRNPETGVCEICEWEDNEGLVRVVHPDGTAIWTEKEIL